MKDFTICESDELRGMQAEVVRLQAERDRLREENARLRGVLKKASKALHYELPFFEHTAITGMVDAALAGQEVSHD